MTISHFIGSFRLHGLHGCIDHLRRRIHRSSEISKWKRHIITDRHYVPTRGITIVGSLSGTGSLRKVLRDFCINLKRANVPCQAFDLGSENSVPDSEYISLLTPINDFKLNRYTDIIGMGSLPPFPTTKCRLSRIGFWEFESGLYYAHPEFSEPGTIITNSDFNAATFKKQLPSYVNIYHILYPFQFLSTSITPKDEIRAKYGIDANDFMVFYNFDFNSGYYRKNPEGAVLAFKKAFSACSAAKLVFKTMGARKNPEFVKRLKDAIHRADLDAKVIFVDRFIPQEELVGLTNACDVYLSLHRGEGFGLGIAEAMSLGKPVIITNYSAPTEFCNETNSILIPYTMVAVKDQERDTWQYQQIIEWADPDIGAAAEALTKLYSDREYANKLGGNGKRSIEEQFSIENFKRSVNQFLCR